MESGTGNTSRDKEFTRRVLSSLVPHTHTLLHRLDEIDNPTPQKSSLSKFLRYNSAIVSDRLEDFCKRHEVGLTRGKFEADSDTPLQSSQHQYFISITPSTNYTGDVQTKIMYSGKFYFFTGFIIISQLDLSKMAPLCFRQYGYLYTARLEPLNKPLVFRETEALLLEEYLFNSLLELFDFTHVLRRLESSMFFIPRFTNREDREVLSLSHVLQWLMETQRPILPYVEDELKLRTRRDINKVCDGQIVTNSNVSPSSIRMDRLEWSKTGNMKTAPEIIHFSLADELEGPHASTLSSQKEVFRTSSKDILLTLCAKDFLLTGLYTDVVQHALLLPLLTHHLIHHLTLSELEYKLSYLFRDKQLLERALAHPSFSQFDTVLAGQVKTTASNCGPRRSQIREKRMRDTPKDLREDIRRAGSPQQEDIIQVRYNEQLEFLGDAALEYLCSLHLFHMLPEARVGQLSSYRTLLVKNRHLATVAKKLNLQKYLLTTEKGTLNDTEKEESDFHQPTAHSLGNEAHINANAIEAILGAVYMDSGLKSAQVLIARLFFPEEDLQRVWLGYSPHPIQTAHPTGDRHLIPQSPILQKLVKLEESTGVQFTHIRLLAKAFTHSSMRNSYLVGGSYEKLEHLGDAVLQFLVSDYLYRRYPTLNEGQFSVMRMALVQNKLLAELSKQLGFDQYIRIEKHTKVEGKILADLVESYLAALLLDKGLDHCKKFLEVCLFPKLMDVTETMELDPNTELHKQAGKICRKLKLEYATPVYRTLRSANSTDFSVGVYFMGQRLGTGSGSRLRDARQIAAKQALKSGILSQLYRRKSKNW